jgi:hypothetical protein
MQTYPLEPHPAHPPHAVTSIEARVIGRDANWLRVRWRIEGSQGLVVPPFAGKGRADELWQTTCFELFLKPEDAAPYLEINLSPSERWNAYDFEAYRWGMAERPFPREPECTLRLGSSFAIFDAAIPVGGLPDCECAMGLSAVIEEQGGVKSYWALAHPDAKPDFHAAACFAATLPAANGA